jgi:hypothetical protein
MSLPTKLGTHMKHQGAPTSENQWSAVVGAAVVLGLLTLVALSALGGWSWMARFLESSAPAWIQAVGSVAAIVAALMVVQRQHALELARRQVVEQSDLQRRARTLRVVFFSAARTCESVARQIGREHITYRLEAAELREVRARLLSIDPMQVPQAKLLLLIEQCTMRLQSCAPIVEELQTPRSPRIHDAVRGAVMAAARECWLGLYEATELEAALSKGAYSDSEPYAFDDFEESRKKLDQIRAEFMQTAESVSAKGR